MALEWWQAVVLGLVQGATEWLPVSSTGHLVVVQRLAGTEVPVAFDLLLHLGSVLVAVLVYRRRLARVAAASLRALAAPRRWPGAWRDPDARLGLLLAVATVPIAVAGVLFESLVHDAFASLTAVGFGLVGTAAVLLSTRWVRPGRPDDGALPAQRGDGARLARPGRPLHEARARHAWLAGAFQAIALLPGVSRSGTAVAGGLHAGLDREAAADLGFLMAIPALLGAAVFQARHAGDVVALGAPALAGLAVAVAVGYATLEAMRAFVRRFGLHPFAGYCLALGLVVLWLAR